MHKWHIHLLHLLLSKSKEEKEKEKKSSARLGGGVEKVTDIQQTIFFSRPTRGSGKRSQGVEGVGVQDVTDSPSAPNMADDEGRVRTTNASAPPTTRHHARDAPTVLITTATRRANCAALLWATRHSSSSGAHPLHAQTPAVQLAHNFFHLTTQPPRTRATSPSVRRRSPPHPRANRACASSATPPPSLQPPAPPSRAQPRVDSPTPLRPHRFAHTASPTRLAQPSQNRTAPERV